MECVNELKSICAVCYCISPECECEKNEDIGKNEEDEIFQSDDNSDTDSEISKDDNEEKFTNIINVLERREFDTKQKLRDIDSIEDDEGERYELEKKLFDTQEKISHYQNKIRKPRDINEVKLVKYTFPIHNSFRDNIFREVYFLRCLKKTIIAPTETKNVESNMEIYKFRNRSNRNLEISNQISTGWLNDHFEKMLSIKTGIISSNFEGRLYVKIYNKSNIQVTIPENAPIGTLVASVYEYK